MLSRKDFLHALKEPLTLDLGWKKQESRSRRLLIMMHAGGWWWWISAVLKID